MVEAPTSNAADVEALGRKWQKRLRLQDWIIEFKVCRDREFVNKDCFGECSKNVQNKVATISILDMIDYDPNKHLPFDVEETVVHELIHCLLPHLSSDGAEGTLTEQGINCLAWAFIATEKGED